MRNFCSADEIMLKSRQPRGCREYGWREKMRRFENQDQALDFINSLPWGTAAGTCRDPKLALDFASAGVRFLSYGSIIEEKGWGGNPGDNFYYDEDTGDSLNAMG